MNLVSRLGCLFAEFVTRFSGRKFLKHVLLFGIIPYLPALAVAYFWPIKPVVPRAVIPYSDEFRVLQFSPDSKWLLSTLPASTSPGYPKDWMDGVKVFQPIRIWDVERGNLRFSYVEHMEDVFQIRFSPDGKVLGLHSKGTLQLLDMDSGREVASLRAEKPSDVLGRFAFTPDGKSLAIEYYNDHKLDCEDHHIKLWHIASQQERGRLTGDFWIGMIFSPDGRRVCTHSPKDGRILLWQISDDGSATLIQEHGPKGGAVSPDLNIVATRNERAHIELWNLSTFQLRHTIHLVEPVDRWPHSVGFTPNGKMLVGDQKVLNGPAWTTVWDVASTPRRKGLFADAFVSSDAEWIAIRTEEGARFINLAKADDLYVNEFSPVGYGFLHSVVFSPDNKTAAIARLYRETKANFLEKWLPDKWNPFYTASLTGGRPYVSLRDVETNRELYAFEECDQAVFSPNGKVLATLHTSPKSGWTLHDAIQLWDLPSGNTQREVLNLAISVWLSSLVLICLLRMAAWYRRTKRGTDLCKIVP
jgi:WD40 repeat protein